MNLREKFVALNINHGGKSVPGFAGDRIVFENLEKIIGCSLPHEYIEFIRYSDGGHPEVGCFMVPGGDCGNIFEVDWFYSVANPELEKVGSVIDKFSGLLGIGTLPIGRDGGGNQFFLLLGPQTSSVWLYLHDEEGKRIKLADCFEDFIFGLVCNPDFI